MQHYVSGSWASCPDDYVKIDRRYCNYKSFANVIMNNAGAVISQGSREVGGDDTDSMGKR